VGWPFLCMGSMGGAPRGAFWERREGASHDLRQSRRPPLAGPCVGGSKSICVICEICGSSFDLETIELRQASRFQVIEEPVFGHPLRFHRRHLVIRLLHQRTRADAQEPEFAIEGHPFQVGAGGLH
jgi:hypothetical protein